MSTSSSAKVSPLPALVAALFAALGLLLAACGGNGDGNGAPAPPVATATPVLPAETPGPAPTAAGAEATLAPAGPSTAEPVALDTPDGVTLRGRLYSTPGPTRRVVVIAAEAEQSLWQPYADELAGQGVAVLTFDPRGRGETGGSANPDAIGRDLDLAVRFLQSREYAQIYIFTVGERPGVHGIGVSARREVAGIVAYAPGAAGADDVGDVIAPKLLIAPQNDAIAVAAMEALIEAAREPKRGEVVPAPPGDDVLASREVRELVFGFLTE